MATETLQRTLSVSSSELSPDDGLNTLSSPTLPPLSRSTVMPFIFNDSTPRSPYDFSGVLHHKQFLSSKRFLAIQGRLLHYFSKPGDSVPKFTIDLPMAAVLPPPMMPAIKCTSSPRSQASDCTFVLTSPQLPDNKGMKLVAADLELARQWVDALMMGINGHCGLCGARPAMSPHHKYCISCNGRRALEKVREHKRVSVMRMKRVAKAKQLAREAENDIHMHFVAASGTASGMLACM